MCGVCGCGGADHGHGPEHKHEHEHEHGHGGDGRQDPVAAGMGHDHGGHLSRFAHAPGLSARRTVQVERDLFAQNQRYADGNRRSFEERRIFTLNVMSSPGSGKTTLLVQTLQALRGTEAVAVIEGDQQTDRDARRIAETGVPVRQINTGRGCHLDAHRVGHACADLPLAQDGTLFIENVGNLVCPAGFDLGEARRIVVLSVTEGEDKPLKYPDMFRAADLMILNKIDLLPYVTFDVEACCGYACSINPRLTTLLVSATHGDGMAEWLAWLANERAQWGRGRAAAGVTGG
ncbi:MAG: hydrogenase nickel incorporation protein HypB [Gammaproteobacteria bacterium]|nr:hydrogenase nickel incorporation protein HypB [Gammaproteobacteria bacterium]